MFLFCIYVQGRGSYGAVKRLDSKIKIRNFIDIWLDLKLEAYGTVYTKQA